MTRPSVVRADCLEPGDLFRLDSEARRRGVGDPYVVAAVEPAPSDLEVLVHRVGLGPVLVKAYLLVPLVPGSRPRAVPT